MSILSVILLAWQITCPPCAGRWKLLDAQHAVCCRAPEIVTVEVEGPLNFTFINQQHFPINVVTGQRDTYEAVDLSNHYIRTYTVEVCPNK